MTDLGCNAQQLARLPGCSEAVEEEGLLPAQSLLRPRPAGDTHDSGIIETG